jgi:hypothetical protein
MITRHKAYLNGSYTFHELIVILAESFKNEFINMLQSYKLMILSRRAIALN